MIDVPLEATATHPVMLLRQWPGRAWQHCWLLPETRVILSEQALLHAIQNPECLDELPVAPYALHSEVKLLPAELTLPASIIQLGDARWVELTLDASQYLVWDNPNAIQS